MGWQDGGADCRCYVGLYTLLKQMSASDSIFAKSTGQVLDRLRATSSPTYLIALVGVAAASILCARHEFGAAGAGGAITIAVALRLRKAGHTSTAELVQDVQLVWFATSPLLSYYSRIPVERSIVTYDRLAFASIAIALIWSRILLQLQVTAQPPGLSDARISRDG